MRTTLAFLLFSFHAIGSASASEDRPLAEQYLREGKLEDGCKSLETLLKECPGDARARFGLGTIRFVQAVEHLAQGFHRFGLRPDPVGGGIPFARLPVPANPNPEAISYDDLRAIFRRLADDLATAEATLAAVQDDSVKLPIRFGLVRLDLDGDGKAGEDETLWKVYARLNAQVGSGQVSAEDAEGFDIAFDRGDAAWMRGYCHLLMALAEVYLAHDAKAIFDHTAHLFFAKPETPFPFLKHDPKGLQLNSFASVADIVALVHLARFPIREPKRMEAALEHLEAMVALSRESWKFYLAETDDDREWIPNPKQSTVIPGGKVTAEMVKGWTDFLGEAEAMLGGKLLVPFWRDAGGQGVNLRKVFTEPRELDAVLWFQGTAAAPYLEAGPTTRPEFWRRMQQVFGGQFIGFALWFN